MYRYFHFAIVLCSFLVPTNALALTEIQNLEQKLISDGESTETLYKLTIAYLKAGDLETAKLYLEYLISTSPTSSWSDRIDILKVTIDQNATRKITKPYPSQSLFVLSSGFDSNANSGTSADSINLSLESGETFFLNVDKSSQKTSSSFVNVMLVHNIALPWHNLVWTNGIEKTKYQDKFAPDNHLIRTGIKWKKHNFMLFKYDSYEKINGFLYSGKSDYLGWLYRLQTDRKIYQLALRFKKTASLHDLTMRVLRDDPVGTRAGGQAYRAALDYRVAMSKLELSFKIEKGIDSDEYNRFFFPGKRNHFTWKTLALDYNYGKIENFNVDLNIRFDDKNSNIEINSWNGWSAKASLSRVF